MTVIGVDLETDQLVLVKNRDFKWQFENVDLNNKPVDFPAGKLYFELQTGGEGNARQTIEISGADHGSYKLSFKGSPTAALLFNSDSGDIQSALEALPNIGVGNVQAVGTYTPEWITVTTFGGILTGVTFNAETVKLINTALQGVFNTLSGLVGTFTMSGFYAPPTYTFSVSFNGALSDQDFLTYVMDIVASSIENVMNSIPDLSGGNFATDIFYAPKRTISIQFLNELGLQPQPELTTDVSALVGHAVAADVTVNFPGKTPLTVWDFDIDGSLASLKIESDVVNTINARTAWQLVFLPDGEIAGGDPVARGLVRTQG